MSPRRLLPGQDQASPLEEQHIHQGKCLRGGSPGHSQPGMPIPPRSAQTQGFSSVVCKMPALSGPCPACFLLLCRLRVTTRCSSPISHGQVCFCTPRSSREVKASHLSSFSWHSGAAFMELLFRVTHLPFGFLVAVQEVRCPILCLKPLPGPLTQLRAWISSRWAGLTLAGCSEQPGERLQGTHVGVSPRRRASPPRHPRRFGSSSFTLLAANFPETPNTAENHNTTHTKDTPDTTRGAQIPFHQPHSPVTSLLAQTTPTGPLHKQPRAPGWQRGPEGARRKILRAAEGAGRGPEVLAYCRGCRRSIASSPLLADRSRHSRRTFN